MANAESKVVKCERLFNEVNINYEYYKRIAGLYVAGSFD